MGNKQRRTRKAVLWNGVAFLKEIDTEETTLVEVFIFQNISQFEESKE